MYLVFAIDKTSTDSLLMSFIDVPKERWEQTLGNPNNPNAEYLEFTWDRLIESINMTREKQDAR